MTTLTPMLQQYLEIKEQHKNELLFFRLGDFYELFNEDAITASRELNLTLTKRAGGEGGGFQYHAHVRGALPFGGWLSGQIDQKRL